MRSEGRKADEKRSVYMHFLTCPRCAYLSYERLITYSHCVLCGFSPALLQVEHEIETLKSVCKYLDKHSIKLKLPSPTKPTVVKTGVDEHEMGVL